MSFVNAYSDSVLVVGQYRQYMICNKPQVHVWSVLKQELFFVDCMDVRDLNPSNFYLHDCRLAFYHQLYMAG